MGNESKARRPVEGDKVRVHDYWTQTEVEGTVQSLLSQQFTMVDDEGHTYFIFYNGAYKICKP